MAGKAQAARSEVTDDKKTVEFHELTLELPPTMPGDILFDFADMQSGRTGLAGSFNLLRTLLGEAQFQALRAETHELSIEEATEELLDGDDGLIARISAAYGMAEGESEASQGS